MSRIYHYEPEYQSDNPYALTGISVAAKGAEPQRLSTWKYDRWARVIAVAQHGRSIPSLALEYIEGATRVRDGLTRITASNGHVQNIRFRRAGQAFLPMSRSDDASQTQHSSVMYDRRGRLHHLDGLTLARNGAGELHRLTLPEPGWPGLAFSHNRQNNKFSWESAATGATVVSLGRNRRPLAMTHANGDRVQLQYDAHGRLAQLIETSFATGDQHITGLQWRGGHVQRVEHPAEAETRHHDTQGRVSRRTLYRPAIFDSPAAHFDERFVYDEAGRLLLHHLPEGGALYYRWHAGVGRAGGLASLHWRDAAGRVHPVFTSIEAQAGYRYGNGLWMVSAAIGGHATDTLVLFNTSGLRWVQRRQFDEQGRVLSDEHQFHGNGAPNEYLQNEHLHFDHDNQSRMRGARHMRAGRDDQWWYARRQEGSVAAIRHNTQTLQPALPRDASGLPLKIGGNSLRYGAGRRLETVYGPGGEPIAQFRHNVFGHRIIEHDGHITRHKLYLNHQLVAEAMAPGAGAPPTITRRYLYAGWVPIGMIEYAPGNTARLYFVHADLSGAPRIITDERGQTRWAASYTPNGHARRIAGDLTFPLRFPGQVQDMHTGWHDNIYRTYVPELGQYLEPDPIGPLPGTNAYGYAAHQPWRYADPLGLLLFAFDGTRYSTDTAGNAWQLAQSYRDGAAHYHSGPGNSYFLDWDAVVAWRAGRILENQWQALLTSVEQHQSATPLAIDIIGFSRGAALARHFGNRIEAHMKNGQFSVDDPMRGRLSACLDLRFMGLFDTVAQFGVGGSHNHLYDFGVSELWSWVAHAVAMHEHRWAFPLTSADAGGAGNVVEAPFVGAHADIGGGVAVPEQPDPASPPPIESDLAKVALQWMHWQALAANVQFDKLPSAALHVGTPILRDMRNPLLRSLMDGDRAIMAPSGAVREPYQNDDPRLGDSAREQVETFIHREREWRNRAGHQVGVVDMHGYAQWLEHTLGWQPQ